MELLETVELVVQGYEVIVEVGDTRHVVKVVGLNRSGRSEVHSILLTQAKILVHHKDIELLKVVVLSYSRYP